MTGIIIGRFQVPRLHPGHLHLIATALMEQDNVVVIIGRPSGEEKYWTEEVKKRHPYSLIDVKTVIKRVFPQVEILDIGDKTGEDNAWSYTLDHITRNYPHRVLYYSRDSFKDHYKGKITRFREVEEVPNYSGTKIRENAKNIVGVVQNNS